METEMVIALDYDKTFTLDPVFWRTFIAMAQNRGHIVICVTGRSAPPGPDEPDIGVMIICAPDEYKQVAAERAGYYVNVWIDDMPELIAPSKILSFD